MPITKSANKKQRVDIRRTKINQRYRKKMRSAVKQARIDKTKKALSIAYRALDLATKKGIIHKNKASRLKSRLSKLIKK